MTNKLRFALPVAALTLALPATTWAASESTASNLSAQDQQFIKDAGPANHAEVEFGKLASEKADHLSVKEFGNWMQSAHGAAGRELASIMSEMQLAAPPTNLTSEQSQAMQRLQGLSGDEFDRRYIRTMVQDHEKVIPIFEKEADSGENKLVRTYAENLVPALKDHLAEAQTLDRDLFHGNARVAGNENNRGVVRAGVNNK